MKCCEESSKVEARLIGAHRGCQSCDGPSRPVTLRTMLLMLKPEFFDQVGENQYRFCASPDCPVIYFSRERFFRPTIFVSASD